VESHCSKLYVARSFPLCFCADFLDVGPVCNEPVPFRPGQDPNARMDVHLERECKVLVGDGARKTQSSAPRCKKGSCNKVLFAPIRCDVCLLDSIFLG